MPEDSTYTPSPIWLDLERILPLEGSNVSGLSQDSLKRHHADKIIRRRLGMRARHALMLGEGNAA
jgi:hypothetical protein